MKTRVQSLIGYGIDEKAYKADLELQDRYTAYSAEILRLALLGIAGDGFLLKDVVFADQRSRRLGTASAQRLVLVDRAERFGWAFPPAWSPPSALSCGSENA
jgi:hypothetical protein